MLSVSVNGFEKWRTVAREYLLADISPESIQWQSEQQADLFANLESAENTKISNKKITVPPKFISQVRQASCYLGRIKPETKWSLFYSLLWRITKINRNTLLLKSDSEVQQLERMVKSVNRDTHKMKAFVRFKTDASVFDEVKDPDPYYTAWFDPEHAIIEAVSPFFVKRFTGMKWSIMTPQGCAHWNRQQLVYGPGISRPDIRDDEFEHFWRAYYLSIFNPARLKENAMRAEMPKKYWKYLPESICIRDLTSDAAARVANMISAGVSDSERVRRKAKRITALQDQLRKRNQS